MLHKKYRPKKFSELLGQEKNVAILKELLKDGIEDTPSLIFTGPFGAGKTSASRVLAKAILCEKRTEDLEPCGSCQSCTDFEDEKNPNYFEIDAATNGDVDSIRSLRSQTQYQSVGSSKYKITNIDEAHNITKQGYNALLKILEQGASHHLFMFCTNEPDKVIDTVQSRCWQMESLPVNTDLLGQHLREIVEKESIVIEPAAVDLICKLTAPHIRNALNALDFLNYRGNITVADVEAYFRVQDKKNFLNLVLFLKGDVNQSFAILQNLLLRHDVDSIFEKIVNVCLMLEGHKVGVKHDNEYYDDKTLNELVALNLDYLGVASYLLKIEKPIDLIYLKFMFLELNRILNEHSTANYAVPNIATNSTGFELPNTKPDSAPIIKPEPVSMKRKLGAFEGTPDQIMGLSEEKPQKVPDAKLVTEVNAKTLGLVGASPKMPLTPAFRSFTRERKPVSPHENFRDDVQKKEKR